ncbi:hypothetical protein [Arthrobacter mobilis]|uniref:Helix-turn-helix domain-containing protein n=1 Tax=Arthrobacter mobilis TaxID=2724944 RepID=A0A7X6HFD5_9MICC|nr:hypothetical protein [Arthrobacter mobilis]NKX56011.1 hypothetical protein [Arthrobacter mobilis]
MQQTPEQLVDLLEQQTMDFTEAAECLEMKEMSLRSYIYRGGGAGRLRSVTIGRTVRLYRADVHTYKRELKK